MKWFKRKQKVLDLKGYEGNWVAVKDNAVISHGLQARHVINDLRAMGSQAHGVRMWFVPTAEQQMMQAAKVAEQQRALEELREQIG